MISPFSFAFSCTAAFFTSLFALLFAYVFSPTVCNGDLIADILSSCVTQQEAQQEIQSNKIVAIKLGIATAVLIPIAIFSGLSWLITAILPLKETAVSRKDVPKRVVDFLDHRKKMQQATTATADENKTSATAIQIPTDNNSHTMRI